MLKQQDLVLVCYRRLFANDENRFFLGQVDGYENGIVKLTGHSFLHDGMTGKMTEKSSLATKIMSISSGSLIVYLLPDNVDINALRFEQQSMKLTLVDDSGFCLDLTEKSFRAS